MLRALGKLMQVAGMIVLPIAMLLQLTAGMRAPTGAFSVSAMLVLMVFGVALFVLGRYIEGFAR